MTRLVLHRYCAACGLIWDELERPDPGGPRSPYYGSCPRCGTLLHEVASGLDGGAPAGGLPRSEP